MISLRLLILTVIALLSAISLLAAFFAFAGSEASLIVSTILVSVFGIPLLVLITVRGVLGPVLRIQETVRKIAQGTYDVQFPRPAFREMRELAEDLDAMAETIRRGRESAEEAKATLEIRVRARTRELQELAKGLEQKVKERTKELEDKVRELEKFQRLAVGRELRMVELKKELSEIQAKRSRDTGDGNGRGAEKHE